ncbi:protein of unknown function [Methylocaldum szegediense]|uniref:Uncharacterized protein n=1 Tax=Methylocaldum szegediense TaxID=73780 RepID=A0ABM9HW08_9GAMM|nr:protein of unknown function [Methylocaldum szegediense]
MLHGQKWRVLLQPVMIKELPQVAGNNLNVEDIFLKATC